MANLTRWEPFRELMEMRRDWDRVFDDNFFRPLWSGNGHSAPLVDLYQTADEIHVKAAMPGVKPEDVEIQVNGDVLTIKAEVKQEEDRTDATLPCTRTPLPVVCPHPQPARPGES